MNKTRVPKASPEPLPELAAFLSPFTPLFRRHTSRDSMERYVTGLLSDLPHKTCETIAEVIAGTSLERLQHLLTDAAWNPLELDEARVKRLLELHPVTDGMLVFDDTGLPKKWREGLTDRSALRRETTTWGQNHFSRSFPHRGDRFPELAISSRGNTDFSLEGLAKGHFRLIAHKRCDRLDLDTVLEPSFGPLHAPTGQIRDGSLTH